MKHDKSQGLENFDIRDAFKLAKQKNKIKQAEKELEKAKKMLAQENQRAQLAKKPLGRPQKEKKPILVLASQKKRKRDQSLEKSASGKRLKSSQSNNLFNYFKKAWLL